MRYLVLLLFAISLMGENSFAQTSFPLDVIPLDKDTVFMRREVTHQKVFSDPSLRDRELQLILFQLYGNGYITATFDSVVTDSNRLIPFLFIGKQYKWVQLTNGNIDEGLMNQVGFREKSFANKVFSYHKVSEIFERLLEVLENNGFPFAEVRLDSFKFEGNKVSSKIFVNKHRLIRVDSIAIEGDAMIKHNYIYNYLGIKPKSIYNEELVRKISTRIQELPFVQEEDPFNIVFVKDKARINLFLKRKKASRFNFIIGFLPNPQTTVPTAKSKLLITGDGTLNLQNPFGGGEVLDVKWKRYKANTQSLKTNFLYPYLPYLPFGIDLKLEIYRHDTLFVERTLGFGFQYMFVGNNYIKAYINNKTSRLLSINEAAILGSNQLPKNIDISYNLYGLEYNFEKLDYRLNPRSGYAFRLNGGLGEKEILKNDLILDISNVNYPSFDGSALYDSVELKTIQYKITYVVTKFWRVMKRSTIMTSISGGAFVAENIFQNELFRIGGNRLLRGFDEESVFASLYNIFSLEYRFLLSRNSNFYVFSDVAYVENPTSETNQYDQPLGIGTGMTFETKAGIFSLSYGLGMQLDQSESSFDFRSAKIHFGYLNYF